MITTAMILAAGRGERLRPITDVCPKALCSVQGLPLIEHHVANLARAGVTHIVINHAHLGGQIRHHLGCGKRWGVTLSYAPEPPGGLETGGGIFNALPLLGKEPFITVNADIFTDYSFAAIARLEPHLVHLVLIPKPAYSLQGDFGLQPTNRLDNNHRLYTFAGIAAYHPELFKHHQPGRYSIVPTLRELTDKQHATGEIYAGQWFDIGTVERLKRINSD